MKKLNKSGARLLCAITLALLTTVSAHAQIWGTEAPQSVSSLQILDATNSSVTVTATPDPDDASKQRVVIFREKDSGNDGIYRIWVTLIVSSGVTINGLGDIPNGTYQINDSKAVGTALASEGLTTAVEASASIIGTGGCKYKNSTYYWYHCTENVNTKGSFVTVGVDYTGSPQKVMCCVSGSFHSAEQTQYLSLNLHVCNSGNANSYTYCQSNPAICGSGTAAYNLPMPPFRKLGYFFPTVTATPDDGFTFHHWEDGDGNNLGTENPYIFYGWGPESIKAVFSDCGELAPATPTYTVAATVSPVGAGTVTGADTYDEGDDVTLTATPTNRRYRFLRWTESASQVGTETSYTINDIAANHTLVAEFEEIPVTIADNEESSYYSSTLSTFTGSMDFQLMRTFYAGMWNTVCFPFALSSSQIAASDMSGATFYTLTSVTGDAAEGLDFNVSEVTSLSARTPYLVQVSGANIVNPVFESVTLDANAFTNNTTGTDVDQTKFFGTLHPTDLAIGENSGFLFLGQNNTLYWPNTANKIRAFRAYFYSGNNAVQAIHPRVRIVLQNETTTGIEEIGASGESGVSGKSGLSGASVKKYLRNGSLVIERDGIRYNAVGEQIK